MHEHAQFGDVISGRAIATVSVVVMRSGAIKRRKGRRRGGVLRTLPGYLAPMAKLFSRTAPGLGAAVADQFDRRRSGGEYVLVRRNTAIF